MTAAMVLATHADASYTAQVSGQTLQVTGNQDADNLVVFKRDADTLGIDVGADGTLDFAFPLSSFDSIDIDAGGGDDQVAISQVNGPLTDKAISIEGGAGDDTLTGADGAETIDGGPGNDLIDGNRGNDTETGGTGNDTFRWDPGDGSDVLDGQGGSDVLQFNGSNAGEQFTIDGNGARVLFRRDVGAITQDLGTIERINVRTLGASDSVTVGDLTGTGVALTDVDLGGDDAAADTVTALGTDGADRFTPSAPGILSYPGGKVQVDNADPSDHLTASGLGGDDAMTMDVSDTGPVFGFDGGPGNDSVRFNGDPVAGDSIGIANNGTFVRTSSTTGANLDTTATENLDVEGLGGDDTITGQNGIAALTHLTIGGGDGADTLLGGDGDDTINGGNGDDLIDGNRGSDTETGGAGNDTFQWDPGDGSDVLDGQGGKDALQFNGSNIGEKIDVSANGTRGRLTRDVAAITQDFGTIETVRVRALGGADSVTAGDLTGTGVALTDVDLGGFDGSSDAAADTVTALGGDGADRFTATGPGQLSYPGGKLQVENADPSDHLTASGLGGDDTLTTSYAATGTVIGFDGGAGNDSARFNGNTFDDDDIGVANNGTFVRTFSTTGASLDTTATESLDVETGGGNDRVAGQNGIGTMTHLTIGGGDGEDTLLGGDGDDTINGGNGDDLIDGNRGSDTEKGGAGNDTFQWDPGDGSDVLDGQDDNDTLQFNGSNVGEKIEVSANGSRARLTRDIAAVTQDFGTIEAVNVRALGSSDTVTVDDLAGTRVGNVNVDLGVDGAADTVIQNGSAGRENVNITREGDTIFTAGLAAELQVTGSDGPSDTLQLNTLGGRDSVFVAPDVPALITPLVDLGADQ